MGTPVRAISAHRESENVMEDSRNETKAEVLQRLARVEGQVRGVTRLVEENRDAPDIIARLGRARAALGNAEDLIVRSCLVECVEQILGGDAGRRDQATIEFLDILRRARS